jgi:hypothetical protein
MTNGNPLKPRILHGAFVEYGLSVPPRFVAFQFNPVQLSRSRSLSYSMPSASTPAQSAETGARSSTPPPPLRELHRAAQYADLDKLRDDQQVTIQEESISLELRLDASERLAHGDIVAEQFGIGPELATLELMVVPKDEGGMGAALESALSQLLGAAQGFSFTKGTKPPLILFVWGRQRVLPVNITALNITETEFSTTLQPIRATASVTLSVIEGPNPLYNYTRGALEAMSLLNVRNAADVADVIIPG